MSRIEKRIIIDESTERVFDYGDESELSLATWSGLLGVRDVHRLSDGMFYTNHLYSLTGAPLGSRDVRLEFAADQSALIAQLREFDMVMTWKFQPDRATAPRLTLDGVHTYWSPC